MERNFITLFYRYGYFEKDAHITFRSNKSSIAAVSKTGKITAKRIGTAKAAKTPVSTPAAVPTDTPTTEPTNIQKGWQRHWEQAAYL